MKVWRTSLVGAGLLLGLTACGQKTVSQVDSAAAPPTPAKAAAAPATADAKPINTKCPVMGGDVDPSVTTVWQGKTVAFCCKDCVAKFNADPAKYAAKLTPDAQAKSSEMPGMDHGKMQGMDHGSMPGMDHGKMQGMDHGSMPGMDHSKMPMDKH